MEHLRLFYEVTLERFSLQQLALAFGFVLGALILRKLLLYALGRYAGRLEGAERRGLPGLFLDALSRPLGMAILLLGLYLAVLSFRPSARIAGATGMAGSVLFGLVLTWLMLRLVDVFMRLLQQWTSRTDSTLDDQLVPLIGRAAKVAVGILAALMILQNFGYSVSGLIAGLGVGGLAVALAAQKTLADLFGSIMLLVDRPFVLGDWIRSPDGSIEGVVERIGFRSTRIRTFDQTLITIPNSRLADFVIDNVTLRPARRVWMTVRVPYRSTAEQMREIIGRIEAILRAHPEVDQESFLMVKFTDFGEYSREIMVYYFTVPTGWVDHLRIREEVNFRIVEALEEMGLSIAFPTQIVHLSQGPQVQERSHRGLRESPDSEAESSG